MECLFISKELWTLGLQEEFGTVHFQAANTPHYLSVSQSVNQLCLVAVFF